MASESEILEVLKMLTEAYRLEPNDTQTALFLETLKPFDAEKVRMAARQWIKASKWFPTIAELHRECMLQEEIGTVLFPDALMKKYFELQERWFIQGEYNRAEYESLAQKFRSKDRPNMAEHVMYQAIRIEKLHVAEISGEESELVLP